MLKFKSINIICITLIIVLLILNNSVLKIPLFLYFALITIWLLLTVIGSFNITWNYHINSFNNNSKIIQKKIAITFDDGPNEKYTLEVLNILKKHNAIATFFCIGKNIEQHPEIVKKIIADGHLIGNHSYSHSNHFGLFKTPKVVAELQKTNKIVECITDKKVKYFRPPFGVTNPSIAKALKHTKHISFGWSVRSLDTVIRDPKKITNRIINKVKPGAIILLHDSHNRIAPSLEQLLIFLQENNYEIVSLEALSNTKAYA